MDWSSSQHRSPEMLLRYMRSVTVCDWQVIFRRLDSHLSFPPGVPLVGNLRTRLLALHVLEAVLPSCESNMEDEQMTQVSASFCWAPVHSRGCSTEVVCCSQVVERLFSLLSDCMWEAPVAQAKHTAQIKEKVQELKLQVWKPQQPSSSS